MLFVWAGKLISWKAWIEVDPYIGVNATAPNLLYFTPPSLSFAFVFPAPNLTASRLDFSWPTYDLKRVTIAAGHIPSPQHGNRNALIWSEWCAHAVQLVHMKKLVFNIHMYIYIYLQCTRRIHQNHRSTEQKYYLCIHNFDSHLNSQGEWIGWAHCSRGVPSSATSPGLLPVQVTVEAPSLFPWSVDLL